MKRTIPLLAVLAAGAAAAPAIAAATLTDTDADVVGDRLRVEADTRGATRVTFLLPGRTVAGRLVDSDDGEREWRATVKRRAGERPGTTLRFRVRACDGSQCRTTAVRERLERED